MAEKIGRLGYLGLAIESTPGTPQGSPSVFLPFTENTLEGQHDPISDISSRATRIKEAGSVRGRQYGQGSVTIYLDSINTGYLLKMALGQEANTQLNASPPVYDHLMYPTVSGNTPTTATLWSYKGVDVEQYSYASIDTLEIEVSDNGIATAKATVKAKFPTTGASAPTLTTTSGTLFTWKDLSLLFGSTVQVAQVATPTKVTNFKCQIMNNVKLDYKSGSASPDTLVMGQLEVKGSYMLFFENTTDRDNYFALNKQSMIMSMAGAGLGVGFSERLQLVFKKVRIHNMTYDTGLDNLFAITCEFVAELDQVQAGYVESTVRNQKSTTY